MDYVIFDLEWNNAYDYKEKKGVNEIIEIGAVRLDKDLNISDTFTQLVKPKLSKNFPSVLWISQALLKKKLYRMAFLLKSYE